jgi:DNA-binding response OmpR family regulator
MTIAPPRVLVADEDPTARMFLTDNLAADGYESTAAAGSEEATTLLTEPLDALLIDFNGDTLGMIDAIRGEIHSGVDPQLPILVLTSHAECLHRTRLLDRGADDVLTKPYAYPELRSRLAALLRRSTARRPPRLRRAGGRRADAAPRRAWIGEHQIPSLPEKEYQLLLTMISEPTRVFTRQQLMRAIWGQETFGRSRTLDSHCARLRRKLCIGEERFLINTWGVGYVLSTRTGTETTTT